MALDVDDVFHVLTDNKAALVAGTGGLVVGAGLGAATVAIAGRKSKRKSKSRRKRVRSRRGKRKNYKYARTAGKGKDRSTRRIRMTKNGQPYVILKSGKARFISKKSARSSRRRKGGRY